ncbi:MAG: hypothetical protein JO257_36835 [Deltaproteobacteria bacterium]|nr:hypothetical protein [Deltaproteobacteria bacterium]
MKILVTWGSERGGTEGIARAIADVLTAHGHNVTAIAALDAPPAMSFEAAVIGGALYAGRWHRHARQYAEVNKWALRKIPVWFFSSGPLDASADSAPIEAVRQTHSLMQRIGVTEHVTFGGRLEPNAHGFIAHAMAKSHAGDWRNFERVRAWAERIAGEVETAKPRPAVPMPAHSAWRLLGYALAATCISILTASLLGLPAFLTPAIVAIAAVAYFRPEGAREPLPTAAILASAAAIALIVISGLGGLFAFWLPVAVAFVFAWLVGDVFAMLPRRMSNDAALKS